MQLFDWIVLIVTLLFIVIYGAWKTRGSKNVEDYILGNNELMRCNTNNYIRKCYWKSIIPNHIICHPWQKVAFGLPVSIGSL